MQHTCSTIDGDAIYLGLKVRDYDAKIGMVVRGPNGYELEDETCHSGPGHNGHWWTVCPDRPYHDHELETHKCSGSIFDGSRLTTRDRDGKPIPQLELGGRAKLARNVLKSTAGASAGEKLYCRKCKQWRTVIDFSEGASGRITFLLMKCGHRRTSQPDARLAVLSPSSPGETADERAARHHAKAVRDADYEAKRRDELAQDERRRQVERKVSSRLAGGSRPSEIAMELADESRRQTAALAELVSAADAAAAADAALLSAVRSARDAGASWAQIGAMFGTSRQAAFQRFADRLAGEALQLEL